jgi:L-ribulokinase
MWSKRDGFPEERYFAALDPRLARVIDEKMSRTIVPVGDRAGELTETAARWTGLRPGTAVAVANVDAHVSVPASTVTEPGRMVAVMGTSTCHLVLGPASREVEGMCGVVEDGIIPGWFGYEAGQSGVGDIFAWFVDQAVPPEYHALAARRGHDLHVVLEEEAARLRPGESGLLALDWWNGNRSILVDVDLTGLLLGATLATRAPEIYRALIEATAFGTRLIVDSFRAAGVAVDELVACGGLPQKNRLLMQIYADVTNRPLSLIGSEQGPALGSAIHAAVAAGAHPDVPTAAAAMGRVDRAAHTPDPARARAYDALFAEYRLLHDHFGRGENDVLHRLRAIRRAAVSS